MNVIKTRSVANGTSHKMAQPHANDRFASGNQPNDSITLSANEEQRRCQNIPTIYQLTNQVFSNALKSFKAAGSDFKVNEYVLGRMKGYAPWPAKIQAFTKDGSKLKCYFFGSHNTGTVDRKNAIPFQYAPEVIRLIKLRQPHCFIKGVRELEIENNIPIH